MQSPVGFTLVLAGLQVCRSKFLLTPKAKVRKTFRGLHPETVHEVSTELLTIFIVQEDGTGSR